MYNKSIRVDLPVVTISVDDVPEEAKKGFKVLGYIAAILVDYMINHYKDFVHANKYSSRDMLKSIYEENIRLLKEKINGGEILMSKPEDILVDSETIKRLQNSCPYAALETAVRLCEDYFKLKRAYNGSHSMLPRPTIPDLIDCANFKVQHASRLFQDKRIKFPFIIDGRLYCSDSDLLFEDKIQRGKNINIENSYFVLRNENICIEVHPIMFISKPYYYSLHDVVTMGVDLGTINDATCAIYNNRTGEVSVKQIIIPEKNKIISLQGKYKEMQDMAWKKEIAQQINALKEKYRDHLAEEIMGLALETKSEYVFFEGLFEQKCKGAAMTLWDPKAVLEKVYEKLHNAGIAYQSVSPVYTSRYYAGGGIVDRIVTDRSKAFSPDGKLIDADKNAALNIVARGMVDMYFDSLPDDCLVSIIQDDPRLLICNEIIFDDLKNIRKYVNDIIDTSKIYKRIRYFNRIKKSFCNKHELNDM